MSVISSQLEDVQASADKRNIAIDKVGIKDIRHPIKVLQRDGEIQHSVANVSMYVELPHHQKGTHMSRFIEILNETQSAYTTESFAEMLNVMTQRLEANQAYVEMTFPFFVNKKAPASGSAGLIDYEMSLLGEINNGKATVKTRVVVAATSLCPCSKKISDYGAHNQRSHITITAQSDQALQVEQLIDIAEKQASAEVFSILKRSDEKVVTEQAYDNPKFVEDLIRDVASSLDAVKSISAYTVEAENFESIHNHSAYAMVSKG
ncbi:MAG: GTP cyclohydrolase I [Parvicella sp.]|jgi:GTP cyclohydrolase I